MERRTFLKGCGTALALPLLDAVPVLAAPRQGPKRLAFVFIPNGIHMRDWTPAQEGTEFDLPWILEPLAPVKQDLLLLTGLTHDKGRANGDGPGDHARSAAVFLTGAQPKKTGGADIRVGVSADQLAAQAIGKATRFPSLELGCEPARQSGQCDSGYSCAYSSNISWRSARTPMGKEVNPRLVFERLFTDGRPGESARAREERLAARKSILDYVRDDGVRLWSRLGKGDRHKLDEYFDGVREIERRLEMGEKDALPDGVEAPRGIPRVYSEHVRLMYDMLALAFRADLTRVATFMLANEGSNRTYPEIDVRGGHHYLTHHGGDRAKIEQVRKINRFHSEQLAYFLQQLESIPEGDGTLLDNCTILYGSGISDGNRHNHDDLPCLIAGRGAGTITPGRHVRYTRNTPMNNLYLSLLERMGANVPSFGDSTGKLGGL